MHELRLNLAQARANLRSAKDHLDTVKAMTMLNVVGKNDDERKRHAAVLIAESDDYQNALTHVRACETSVEKLEAEIAEQEYELRVREVAARERLAEALMGRRSDDAAVDTIPHSSLIRQRIARGGYADAETDDWYKQG